MTEFETFVFMDLESTGLLTPDHNPRITELCFQAVHKREMLAAHNDKRLPRVVNKINLCFDPEEELQPGVPELTGLCRANLTGLSKLDELSVVVMDSFIRRLASPVCLLAHNGYRFDYPILQAELALLNTTFSIPYLQCVDTLDMFRALDDPPWSPWQPCHGHQATSLSNGIAGNGNHGYEDDDVDKDKENSATTTSNTSHDTPKPNLNNSAVTSETVNNLNSGSSTSTSNSHSIPPYKPKLAHRKSFESEVSINFNNNNNNNNNNTSTTDNSSSASSSVPPSSERYRNKGTSDSDKIEIVGCTDSPSLTSLPTMTSSVDSSSCDTDVSTTSPTSGPLKRKLSTSPSLVSKTFENKSIKRRLFEKYSRERETALAREREEAQKSSEVRTPTKTRSSPENLTATSTCVTRSCGRKYLAATLEAQGTIILWHDHFNEEFFREHLEISTDKRADDPPSCDSPTEKTNSALYRSSMTAARVDTSSYGDCTVAVATKTVSDFPDLRKGKLLNNGVTTTHKSNGVLHGLLVNGQDAPELIAVSDRKLETGSPCAVDLSMNNTRTTSSPRSCLGLNNSQNQNDVAKNDVTPRRQLKTSYGLKELYRRITGQYPSRSHTAEDDCMALMELVCHELPRCLPWIHTHNRQFTTITPMY